MAFFPEDFKEILGDDNFCHQGEFMSGALAGTKISGILDVDYFDERLGSMRVSVNNCQLFADKASITGVKINDDILVVGKIFKIQAILDDMTGAVVLDLAEVIEYETVENPFETSVP